MDVNLGKIYEGSIDKELRKALGQYYTPKFIIDYILNKTLANIDIIENPFIKIIDISCGAGYFLLAAYDLLKERFLKEINNLKEKYENEIYMVEKNGKKVKVLGKDYWTKENIHYHILKNCIYGADKDSFAIEIAKELLLSKEISDDIDDLNLVNCDSLIRWEKRIGYNAEEEKMIKFWSNKFDLVVGNPPYIGHKQMNINYKKWLLEEYEDVFRDKSDISYCFFKRILEILKTDGMAGIISSRYFMESPTGTQLRGYLMNNANILEIVDFYGAEIFKDIGVATAIYIFTRKSNENNVIAVKKLVDDSYKFSNKDNLNELIKSKLFEEFTIKKASLNEERWMLISKEKSKIYKKIEAKAKYSLKDVATTFQGVITGHDKAFVLAKEDLYEYNIEGELVKNWIKNSHIEKYKIRDSNLFLIYADLIEDEREYPQFIQYIKRYRDRLENRRECKRGVRCWYQLQWGRNPRLFDRPKIIFPFKSNENRFALDLNNRYFSADVYALITKDEYKDEIPMEYLLGLLNSKLYEFYFKLFGKKMGKGIYDYYPNSVLDLKIITGDIVDDVTSRVQKILELIDSQNKDNNIEMKINFLKNEIDEILYSYLNISKSEIELINQVINPAYFL